MKVLIIDDEAKAQSVLKTLLLETSNKISEIFVENNLLKGVATIKKEQPQIVFLDIEMPEHTGLEIFNFINKEDYNFELIFVTAYNQYAIQAFQLSAIDYLLKPVRPSQLKEAFEKACQFIKTKQINTRLLELKETLQNNNFKKIGLPYSEGIKFVDFNTIISLEADGMYTKVSTLNDDEILVSKPLKFFVEALQKINTFYRPHRSYLINLTFIKEYIRKDGGYILMENNKSISISREKKDEFLAIVQNI